MSTQHYPIVGNWYKTQDGHLFEVVAFDEEDNYIELQYFGGEIDEVDFEGWYSLVMDMADQPDDWTGPYDDMDREDLGYSDLGFRPDMHTFTIEDIE